MNDLKKKLYIIIFEADTKLGKLFDVTLLVLIILSVFAVSLESVEPIKQKYGTLLTISEWVLTIFFTVEYILRIYTVNKPFKYAFSFFGIIDLLSIIPTYLSLFIIGSHNLVVIRALRLLRVFRVLKLTRFLGETKVLKHALEASFHKITVFIGFIVILANIIGVIIYLIEGPNNGFTSIPKSMYWAIVTLTTVGFGDIVPQTSLGKFFASIVMIMGYGVIAVPTGIVSVELSNASENKEVTTRTCQNCSSEGHAIDAVYCKYCSEELDYFVIS